MNNLSDLIKAKCSVCKDQLTEGEFNFNTAFYRPYDKFLCKQCADEENKSTVSRWYANHPKQI